MRKRSCSSLVIVVLALVFASAGAFGPATRVPDAGSPMWKCPGKDALAFDISHCLSVVTRSVAMAAEPFETLASSTGDIPLGAEPVEVTLAAAPSGGAATLASRLAAVGPDRRLYLVVKGLCTNEQPETIYQIYLALPRAVAPTRDGIHYVGSLNFFNAAIGERNDQAETGASRLYSYDVTDLVRTLLARHLPSELLKVTIVPAGAPRATAKPFVGEITLIAQ